MKNTEKEIRIRTSDTTSLNQEIIKIKDIGMEGVGKQQEIKTLQEFIKKLNDLIEMVKKAERMIKMITEMEGKSTIKSNIILGTLETLEEYNRKTEEASKIIESLKKQSNLMGKEATEETTKEIENLKKKINDLIKELLREIEPRTKI